MNQQHGLDNKIGRLANGFKSLDLNCSPSISIKLFWNLFGLAELLWNIVYLC
jgi:hypothetical protein